MEPAEPEEAAGMAGRRDPVGEARVAVGDDDAPRPVGLVAHLAAVEGEEVFARDVQAVEMASTAKIAQSSLSRPSVSLVSLKAERAIIPITAAPMP